MTLPKIDSLSNDQIRVMCARIMFPEMEHVPIEHWYTQEDDYSTDWVFKQQNENDTITVTRLPRYPTDANAALTLCARMAEKGLGNDHFQGAGCPFHFAFYDLKGNRHQAKADTLQLAICHAFLIANHLAE